MKVHHFHTPLVFQTDSTRTRPYDKGSEISYEKLVVATGCTALKLTAAIGGSLPGVHYVRNNADALALYDAMVGMRNRL